MKTILLLGAIFFSVLLHAQQYNLVFTNLDSSKTVTIKEKDLVRIAYSGYIKQSQIAEGFVTNLNDSTITLIPRKKLFQKKLPRQTLFLKDITGFRRYSRFRPASEVIYGIASIGLTGAIAAIVANSNPPAALNFITPAGTQIVTSLTRNLIMSNKIKHYLPSGWQMKLVSIN
jgi:hypothetical protein